MGKLLDLLNGMTGRDTTDAGRCQDRPLAAETPANGAAPDRLPPGLGGEVKQGVEVSEQDLGQLSPSPTPGQEGTGGSQAAQGRSLGQEGQGR